MRDDHRSQAPPTTWCFTPLSPLTVNHTIVLNDGSPLLSTIMWREVSDVSPMGSGRSQILVSWEKLFAYCRMFSINLWEMVLIVAYWAMVSVMDPDKYQVDSVLFSLIIAHIYYFEGAGMCNVSNSIRRPCVGPGFLCRIFWVCVTRAIIALTGSTKNIYCPGSYKFLGFWSPLLTLIATKDTKCII